MEEAEDSAVSFGLPIFSLPGLFQERNKITLSRSASIPLGLRLHVLYLKGPRDHTQGQ